MSPFFLDRFKSLIERITPWDEDARRREEEEKRRRRLAQGLPVRPTAAELFQPWGETPRLEEVLQRPAPGGGLARAKPDEIAPGIQLGRAIWRAGAWLTQPIREPIELAEAGIERWQREEAMPWAEEHIDQPVASQLKQWGIGPEEIAAAEIIGMTFGPGMGLQPTLRRVAEMLRPGAQAAQAVKEAKQVRKLWKAFPAEEKLQQLTIKLETNDEILSAMGKKGKRVLATAQTLAERRAARQVEWEAFRALPKEGQATLKGLSREDRLALRTAQDLELTARQREELTQSAITLQRHLMNRAGTAGATLRAFIDELDRLGGKHLFGVDKNIIAQAVETTGPGVSKALPAVLEAGLDTKLYKLTPQQSQYIGRLHGATDVITRFLKSEGIEVPEKTYPELWHYVHRLVTGKATTEGVIEARRGLGRIGAKPSMFKARVYEDIEEAYKAGILYGDEPGEYLTAMARGAFKTVADKRMAELIKPLRAVGIKERMVSWYPEVVEEVAKTAQRNQALGKAEQLLTRGLAGERLHPTSLAAIGRHDPEIAAGLKRIYSPEQIPISGIEKAERLRILEAPPAIKEPWQMTKAEATIDLNIGFQREATAWANRQGIGKQYPGGFRLAETYHKEMVVKALSEGKPVPAEVLIDYPDLVPKGIMKPITTAEDVAALTTKIRQAKALTQAEFYKAKDAYRATKERIGPGIGEAWIPQPAFQGQIYPREVADVINKFYADAGNRWLRAMAEAAGELRLVTAALDMSAPFIQGGFILFSHPAIWAKATLRSYQSLIHPEVAARYIVDHADTITRSKGLLSVGPFEYYASMDKLQQLAKKTPLVGDQLNRGLTELYGRPSVAFSHFGNIARIEMFEAMERGWLASGGDVASLAKYLNKLTGVTDLPSIGRTSEQVLNSWVFFAPRYTFAGFQLVAEMFKGGMTGKQALKDLGKWTAGGTLFYIGVCEALGQEPHLDPRDSKFLRIKVGDAWYGMPGIGIRLVRLIGNVAASVTSYKGNEPLDLVKLNRQDNPLIRFFLAGASPLMKAGRPLFVALTKGEAIRNWMGMAVETPEEWAKWISSHFLPFWTETAWELAQGKGEAMQLPAEFMGAVTYPESTWEKREEIREKVTQEKYGKAWDDLSNFEQGNLKDTNPELKTIEQAYIEEQLKRGDNITALLEKQKQEKEQVRQQYYEELNKIEKGQVAGVYKGQKLREAIRTARAVMGARMEDIEAQDKYATLRDWETEWRKLTPEERAKRGNPDTIVDLAYNDYITQIADAPDLEDEYGQYRYDEARRREEELKAKWGSVWDEVEKGMADRRRNDPPILQQYREAQETLRPYWDVPEFLQQKYPAFVRLVQMVEKAETENPYLADRLSKSPGYERYKALVIKLRRYLRVKNPDIDRYLSLFYDGEPWQITDWGRKYLRTGSLS